MSKIKISNVPGFDGEYPLDLSAGFTNGELHFVKQTSGVRAGELEEAAGAGDIAVLVSIAVIAARRNGREIPVKALFDAPAGVIEFDDDETDEDEEEEDERPPA